MFFSKTESTTWAVGESVEVADTTAAAVATSIGKTDETEAASSAESVSYVLNINSMKFHYPTCNSVSEMKAKNRVDLTCTREVLLEQYPEAVPCKRCNP